MIVTRGKGQPTWLLLQLYFCDYHDCIYITLNCICCFITIVFSQHDNCIRIIKIAQQSSCQQKVSLKAVVACRQIRRLLFYCFAHHQIFTSLQRRRRNNERSIENAAVLGSWLLGHLCTSVRLSVCIISLNHLYSLTNHPRKNVKPLMSEIPFSSWQQLSTWRQRQHT